jgi:hypothetical protein
MIRSQQARPFALPTEAEDARRVIAELPGAVIDANPGRPQATRT